MKRRSQKIAGKKSTGAIANIAALPVGVSGTTGLLITLALGTLLLSTFYPQTLSGLRVGAADALSPVISTVSMPLQRAAVFVRDVTGLAAIQAENARLVEENLKLREWYQTALLLEAENKSLRDLMSVKVEPQHTYITARVLSDSHSNFAKSLIVSVGTQEGVRKGQAVIAGEGLIGRVIEAGEKTARVLLITDINSRVPILIEDSRMHAVFAGQNTTNGKLIHLPPESKVQDGVRLVTSGVGGVFPAGLPVGITKLNKNNHLSVEPYADFNRLTYVRVVNRPDDPNLRPGTLNKF